MYGRDLLRPEAEVNGIKGLAGGDPDRCGEWLLEQGCR